MKVSMKLSEAIRMHDLLERHCLGIRSVKVAYAIAKNMQKVKDEMVSLRKASELVGQDKDRFAEFDQKRIELCRKHAKKNDDGSPVIIENHSFQISDMDAFRSEFTNLQAQYRDVIDVKNSLDLQFHDLLNEEVEFEFYTIDAKHLPDEMTTEQLIPMLNFVVGDVSAT